MDMAYRLKKYPSNVFICEGLTYEYDEEWNFELSLWWDIPPY
jgi:hypothetical protein